MEIDNSKKIATLSNLITTFRSILSPIFLIIFMIDSLWAKIAALFIVVLSELSDYYDGKYARQRNEVTDIGKIIDPFADRVFRFVCFLCFTGLGIIPVWMVAIIFYRDAIVTTLRILMAQKNIIFAAQLSGKIKAISQGTAIILINILVILGNLFVVFEKNLKIISYYIMIPVILIAIISGIDYLIKFAVRMKKTGN